MTAQPPPLPPKLKEEEEEEQNSLIDIKAEGGQQSKLSNLCNILQLVFSTVVGKQRHEYGHGVQIRATKSDGWEQLKQKPVQLIRSEPSSTSLFTDSLGSNEIISQWFCRLISYLTVDILLI